MKHREFPRFDETDAPAAARDALARTKRALGALPEPLTRYAASPALLTSALGGLDTFEHTSLSALEREVLAMTMGHYHGCQFCLALHARLLNAPRAPADVIASLKAGSALDDRRLEALRQLVLALLRDHGDVSREAWTGFREAGFTHEQALEVLLGVSVYTLTTLANRLTETSE